MALTAASNGFWLSVTIMDRNEDTTTVERQLDAADMTEALAIAGEHITDMYVVSEAEVLGYSVAERYVNTTPAIPAVGELQTRARLTIRLAAGQGKATHDIFAPKETIFRELTGKDNKIVDISHAGVIDYVENFRTSSVAGLFISDGEKADDTAPLIQGRKVSAKSGLRAR